MNNEITLTDLFDVEMLQRLQDAFAKMMGLVAIITLLASQPPNGRPSGVFAAKFGEICSLSDRNAISVCDNGCKPHHFCKRVL